MFTLSAFMAKRLREHHPVPTLVEERLRTWGATVRHQRVAQNVRALDLCERLDISHPTLRRLERGETSVSAAAYLGALHILGMLDFGAPPLKPELWQATVPAARARISRKDDDDYF